MRGKMTRPLFSGRRQMGPACQSHKRKWMVPYPQVVGGPFQIACEYGLQIGPFFFMGRMEWILVAHSNLSASTTTISYRA